MQFNEPSKAANDVRAPALEDVDSGGLLVPDVFDILLRLRSARLRFA
jgi:hypothetical protein